MTTDTELDELVGRAFVSGLHADPDSEASADLFRSLVEEDRPGVLPIERFNAPVAAFTARPSATAAQRRRPWAAFAAAASVIIILAVVSILLQAESDTERVETTSTDHSEEQPAADRLLVIGPNKPLVIIASDSDRLETSEVLACKAFGWSPGELALVEADLLSADDPLTRTIARNSVFGDQFCDPTGSDTALGSPAASMLPSGSLMLTAGYNTSIGLGAEAGSLRFEGRLAPNVEHIEIVSPPTLSQTFSSGRQWFVLRGSASTDALASLEDSVFSVRLTNGTTTTLSSADLSSAAANTTCFEYACIERAISLVHEEAEQFGARSQGAALSDRRVTQAEYDDALQHFDDCLSDTGLGNATTGVTQLIEHGSADAAVARGCWTEHVQFVEEARLWQLHLWSRLNPEIFTAPTFVAFLSSDATETEVEEVRMLIDEFGATARFVDRSETFDEFREFFESDEELLATIRSGTMPTSFRVSMGGIEDLEDLTSRIEQLSQVTTVVLPNSAR